MARAWRHESSTTGQCIVSQNSCETTEKANCKHTHTKLYTISVCSILYVLYCCLLTYLSCFVEPDLCWMLRASSLLFLDRIQKNYTTKLVMLTSLAHWIVIYRILESVASKRFSSWAPRVAYVISQFTRVLFLLLLYQENRYDYAYICGMWMTWQLSLQWWKTFF